jgi:hypothetical protein
MIRVNLLTGAKKGARRRAGGGRGAASFQLPEIPNVGLLLVVLLIVAEAAGMFVWQGKLSDEANKATAKLNITRNELTQLQKIKDSITALKDETDKLQAQETMFAEMFADKAGPVDALTWLAFCLEPRPKDTTANADKMAMERAGWNPNWNPRTAWFTSFVENDGEIVLTGEALTNGDATELWKRLSSSPYFRCSQTDKATCELENFVTTEKMDEGLKMRIVEFKMTGSVVYLIDPFDKPPPPAADAPADAAGEPAKATEAEAAADARPAALPPIDQGAPAVDAGSGEDADASDADASADADAADAPAPVVPKPAEVKPAAEAAADPEPVPVAPKAEAPPAAEAADTPSAPQAGAN